MEPNSAQNPPAPQPVINPQPFQSAVVPEVAQPINQPTPPTPPINNNNNKFGSFINFFLVILVILLSVFALIKALDYFNIFSVSHLLSPKIETNRTIPDSSSPLGKTFAVKAKITATSGNKIQVNINNNLYGIQITSHTSCKSGYLNQVENVSFTTPKITAIPCSDLTKKENIGSDILFDYGVVKGNNEVLVITIDNKL